MNEGIMRAVGFHKEMDRVDRGNCPLCGRIVNQLDFRDHLSKKEFTISGLCQFCQDEIFRGPEE